MTPAQSPTQPPPAPGAAPYPDTAFPASQPSAHAAENTTDSEPASVAILGYN